MDIQTLLRPLLEHDFGTWSRVDIDGCLGDGDWQPDGSYREGALFASRGGWDWRAFPRESWNDDNGYGDFRSVRISREIESREAESRDAESGTPDAEYRRLLAAAVDVLGPPALVGGPYAFARWRAPQVTVTARRTDHRRGRRVELSVTPTVASEQEEYRNAKWSPEFQPEHCWSLRPQPGSAADRSLEGMMSYGHRNAVDWEVVRGNLDHLFGSLAGDLPLLHPYASGLVWVLSHVDSPEGFLAQGWFAPDECHVELSRDTSLTLPAEGANGRSIAEKTVDVLEAAADSPRQIRYEAFANIKPQALYVIGFGLPHVRDTDPEFSDEL